LTVLPGGVQPNLLASITAKGSLVGVTGSLQTRSYENSQEQRVYITELVVNQFQLMESREVTASRKNRQKEGHTIPENKTNKVSGAGKELSDRTNEENPEVSKNINTNPFSELEDDPFELNSDITDISDDDLPF